VSVTGHRNFIVVRKKGASARKKNIVERRTYATRKGEEKPVDVTPSSPKRLEGSSGKDSKLASAPLRWERPGEKENLTYLLSEKQSIPESKGREKLHASNCEGHDVRKSLNPRKEGAKSMALSESLPTLAVPGEGVPGQGRKRAPSIVKRAGPRRQDPRVPRKGKGGRFAEVAEERSIEKGRNVSGGGGTRRSRKLSCL